MRRIVVLAIGLIVLQAVPALAGQPHFQRPATCEGVQPRARAHLELTVMGDRLEARFVVHQMTLPGHYWRIVLKTAQRPDPGRVFFEGTRLATGSSGDITVQRSVVAPGPGPGVVVKAKARDRQTGQFCMAMVSLPF